MTMAEDEKELHLFAAPANHEPRSEEVERAVNRVCAVLALADPSPRRCGRLGQYVAPLRLISGLAACLCVAGTAWLFLQESTGTAFGRVQERVARTRSVEYRSWYESKPEEKHLVRVLETGQVSVEGYLSGGVFVFDPERRRMMGTNPQTKTAVMVRGLALEHRENLYEQMHRIPKDAIATLPERVLEGKRALGYRARLSLSSLSGNDVVNVWIDPQSFLPLRIELDFTPRGVTEPARLLFSDIRFDKAQDPKNFVIEPPAGYNVSNLGNDQLLDPPNDPNLLKPTLKPGIGIGNVSFGMSREQVIDILGQPDSPGSELPLSLNYFSRGYSLAIDRDGVARISCYSNRAMIWRARAFQGQTLEGIRIGSTRQDLEAAYGSPDQIKATNDGDTLAYSKWCLGVTLEHDRVTSIALDRPKK